ncbi:MAG: DUF2520 domain-containing protein [Pseudomonadota bacterium]|jgi:predicted short-subunit dehydrogenase-like oxidoreductase (DUF2520 family)|nr:DUF2520 domain-containing protein [Syntrophaceae bacterium]MBP7032892.1 DUF2520 domain-containing protein [Syntrophobacterales bacterium]MDI9555783.1 DUF2520 domain-containing protein [Pseudomonadota bacterium]NLX31147.1 DUF2520 domain-containing protein [Deltaproteobacteria bacterium]HNU85266.1 DUF2520 domain-containing protein [Syntrophales bacterium]
MAARERIAILGPGKAGTAVGHLLAKAGHEITAVAGRRLEAARLAAALTGGAATTDFAEAARGADCVFITTSDDAIETVCNTVAAGGGFRKGMKVAHVSGAGGLGLLRAARRRGCRVGCIHPLQTFADVESAVVKIPGSTFGITADADIVPWADRMVTDLGGRPFHVPEEDKPLYHAAACMASNYLVTLMFLVEEVYGRIGLSRREAHEAFWPLVRGTVANLETRGTLPSLTGPIARGDGGTVRKHLRGFRRRFPEMTKLYREMGLFTAEVARLGGHVEQDKLADIRDTLKGGRRK